MKVYRVEILFLLLWCFSCLKASSAIQYGNYEPMTIAQGLNNNTIYDIIHGEKRYVWLSTDMGISRYDGFHFRNFPYTPDANSLETSVQALPEAIRKMYSNGDGLLYLLSQKGKIACFDVTKERYLPISYNRPLDNKKINGIYLAEQYVLYIATTEGIYTAEVKYTAQDASILINLSDKPLYKGNISLLCSDEKGSLFFCMDESAVVHYSMGTQQTQLIDTGDKPNSKVSTLYVNDNHLWIFRRFNNISFYDYNRKSLRTLSESNQAEMRLSDTYVTGITKVDDFTYYCSTWTGLYSIKFASKLISDSSYSIELITPKERTNNFSIENKITSLLWDNTQSVLWLGTFGGGTIKISFDEDLYSRISQQIGAEINGIVEDAKGYIWLATERKGVWKSTTNVLSTASTFVPWTKGVSTSESYQIFEDNNGTIWLGDEHAGIISISPFTEEVRYYLLSPAGVSDFSGNARRFCVDSRDRLWIVTTKGIVIFNNKTEAFSLVISLNDTIKEVTAIAEDKVGSMWVGTNIGIKRVESQSDKLTLVGEYEQQVGLLPSEVYSVYVNSYNQIFVSYTDKIIRIDGREKSKVETLFTLNNGLSSGHVYCMIDDFNGNTWAGSNSGIMTIRNDHTSFYNYFLSGYCNSVCRLNDGRLLWSDSWGLIFFDPLIVKNRQSQNQLLLSDLWVNGKTVTVGEKINGQVVLTAGPDNQRQFVFNAANNDFYFYFSDMQHGMMQRKIAYRMLPDNEWKQCSLENGIHYSNLRSGNYTLEVKLVYPDGSEGEVLEIPITVKDYWWQTIWAIIGYILVTGGAFFAIYSFLLQKKRQKESKEKIEIRNIVAARFIEELRSPLSMIISPLREVLHEKELSKGLSSKVLVAYRNSMGLLNCCDQLLSIFSYVPKDLELAPYSIVKFIDTFVFSMNEFLRVHPIEFQYEKKVKKDFEVWIDKKALTLVLHNMLANAFMHIRYVGAVALILQETTENDVRYCMISVVDNGKPTVKSVEEMKSNLKELAQIDPTEVVLGLGVMEEIIKQHHGEVLLENLKNDGTRMLIKFPVDKAQFEQDKHVTFVHPEEEEEGSILPKQGTPIKTSDENEELLLTEEETAPLHVAGNERKTILIVEDYKDIRQYLETLFENDYTILSALDGAEGVKLAKKELPDLIISDIMMPIKDGYECCREIKEGLETCHIPVILLTAKVEDDDIIKGLEIGADDYIMKPFTPKILKAKVKSLIEGRLNLKKMYAKLLVTPLDEGEASGANDKGREIEDPFISTVVKIIEENIQEPDFSVKRLASDLNMSQPTLYRKVKQCTDFTIIELIRGVRMKKAATLLKKRQHSVQEVAEAVGYNDMPTFRKHFVDTYGTTPSTFAHSIASEKQ